MLELDGTLNWKLIKLLSCGVQSVSTLRRHARCIICKTRDFPDLKINTNKQLFRSPLTPRVCGRLAELMDFLANRDKVKYLKSTGQTSGYKRIAMEPTK